MTKNFLIRTMKPDELDIAIEWARLEGWNPGLHDADCFFATDPKGFFIGLLDSEPIACFSAVAYSDSFGFLGFYIVKPQFRGKGYGKQIWDVGLSHLPTQNIGLDALLDQQANYKKSGFQFAYRTIRYQGITGRNTRHFTDIVKLSKIPFELVKKYDDSLFPIPRHQFLRCWISQPESVAIGAIQNRNLVGYSVIRKCRVGYKIGPLFADNEDVAEELFQTMNNSLPDNTVFFLDVPEVNPLGISLAKMHGMKKVFETARMYSKEQPSLLLYKIFGITSYELG